MTASAEKSRSGLPLSHAHAELNGAQYVVFVDSSRRYVDCTEGVCEVLGYLREEILGKRIEDISYDVKQAEELFAEYVKVGGQEGEYVLRRKDLTPLPIRYRAFVFNDGCHAAIWDPVRGWKEAYLAALLETSPGKQRIKIECALNAIRDNSKASAHEKRLMNDALAMLNVLKKNNARGD